MSDSERIIKLKEYLEKSYNKIAEECGLNNAQTLYDIKNGKHGISKDVAETISNKYLNISKQWLLTGEGEMLISHSTPGSSGSTPSVSALLDIIRSQQETIRSLSETVRQLAKGE